jgi:hypothetical protein
LTALGQALSLQYHGNHSIVPFSGFGIIGFSEACSRILTGQIYRSPDSGWQKTPSFANLQARKVMESRRQAGNKNSIIRAQTGFKKEF